MNAVYVRDICYCSYCYFSLSPFFFFFILFVFFFLFFLSICLTIYPSICHHPPFIILFSDRLFICTSFSLLLSIVSSSYSSSLSFFFYPHLSLLFLHFMPPFHPSCLSCSLLFFLFFILFRALHPSAVFFYSF